MAMDRARSRSQDNELACFTCCESHAIYFAWDSEFGQHPPRYSFVFANDMTGFSGWNLADLGTAASA
jgi:hypothetical protein